MKAKNKRRKDFDVILASMTTGGLHMPTTPQTTVALRITDRLDQAKQSHPSVIFDSFFKRPLAGLPVQLALLSLTDSSCEAIRSIDTPSNLSSIMSFFVAYICAADIIFIEMTKDADPHHLFTGVRRFQNSPQASNLSE